MLPHAERLRRSGLIQRTYAGRKKVSSKYFTLYLLPRRPGSRQALPLVCFVAGKKVHAKASSRNKIKRRLREAYRVQRMRLTGLRGWYTMVWVIHAGALDVTWGELTGAVERMIFEADRKYGRPRARSAD